MSWENRRGWPKACTHVKDPEKLLCARVWSIHLSLLWPFGASGRKIAISLPSLSVVFRSNKQHPTTIKIMIMSKVSEREYIEIAEKLQFLLHMSLNMYNLDDSLVKRNMPKKKSRTKQVRLICSHFYELRMYFSEQWNVDLSLPSKWSQYLSLKFKKFKSNHI